MGGRQSTATQRRQQLLLEHATWTRLMRRELDDMHHAARQHPALQRRIAAARARLAARAPTPTAPLEVGVVGRLNRYECAYSPAWIEWQLQQLSREADAKHRRFLACISASYK